ncbi:MULTISPECIES: hydroxyacid dehydrogenase [unclassified Micromonospora]|uniref:hydroxyacid dehydrogenase n=1 Tax=unclassified Micromonospora TaxID=2617518 RepID=UPI003A875987
MTQQPTPRPPSPAGRPAVFVTQPIDETALTWLAGRADLRFGFGSAAERLADVIEGVDGLLIRTEKLDAALLRRARRLRVICRVGVGLDNVDVAAASAARVPVFNTAGSNARSVTELTFALALAVLRQIPRWDRAVREGRFADREQDPGGELSGKRWGIVGLGHIGVEVARTARHGFGMEVLAYHPTRPASWITERGAEAALGLPDLLSRSDVVSLHVPRSAGTRNLLGPAQFAVMREGSVLVDVSRGGVVDEVALHEALASGRLAGAGIDVFAAEPPPDDDPLFALPNVVLSPHRAGRTRDATRRQGDLAVRRIVDVLGGAGAAGAVNEAEIGPGGA